MIIRLYEENPNPKQIRQVVDCLSDGGLVIVPTDTVYGIACSLQHVKSIETMAHIRNKKLKESNFSVVCSDISQIADFTRPLSNNIFRLLKKNLPGPFTFILEANNKLTKILKFSRKNVGIRIPNNSIILEIIRVLGEPLVITSVKNEDDEIAEYITDPELIYENYQNSVNLVIDAGIGQNVGSTIVDCTLDEPEITRQGNGVLIL
ncbi:MAG: L-threonylcarbamoyladenylate synthase [Salinivirgaceae bacterium]|nr:L-threonylcarbamoyladenylate synthase [Salinivirgaceae bacterium]MDY0280636.1 L-threonylcarbamoyladenylate synthase [Salinivirgaceae bacterium]